MPNLHALTPAALSLAFAWLSSAALHSAEPAPARQPRVVLSGFGPFAGRSINASYLLAKAIAAKHPDWKVRTFEIPVRWGEPAKVLSRASEEPWDVWIAFGEGGPRSLSIETVANNARGSGKDVDGKAPESPLIRVGGDERLDLQADAAALAQRLTEAGVRTRVSKSAGRYLCEEMLYTLLATQQAHPDRTVLFIHVPPYGTALKNGDESETPFDQATIERVAGILGPELVKLWKPMH